MERKTESAIIILPLPPKILSPNCPIATMRGRFMKAAAAKKRKRLVTEAIEDEQIETAPWGKVEVTPEFYFKTNRRRDTDNAIGSLKADYDGIVEAGLIPDDSPDYMSRKNPVFRVDKVNPRLVLKIERVK